MAETVKRELSKIDVHAYDLEHVVKLLDALGDITNAQGFQVHSGRIEFDFDVWGGVVGFCKESESWRLEEIWSLPAK